jgi:hypothetical protein
MRAKRRPKLEIAGEGVKFEAVVSRNISGIEKKLEMEHKLMVTLPQEQ